MYTDSEEEKVKILDYYLNGANRLQTAEKFNIDISTDKRKQRFSNWLSYHTKRRTAAGGKRKTQRLKESYL